MLKIVDISKKIDAFHLSNINLEIENNDYSILLGNSGAGKSVLLEIIAGIVKPDSGKVYLDGKDFTQEPVNTRQIGFLFQDCALFPHLTVMNNIAFPLKIKKENKNKISEKVLHYANTFNITHLLKRFPETLSGGEKQRVALARTLILNPKILLLDEPLSSLDQKNKFDSKIILKKLHREGLTIIHVTHSYSEALALGTKVAIIDNGKLLQTGTPQHIFHKPSNQFVAYFVGNRNFFEIECDNSERNSIAIKNTNVLLKAPVNKQFLNNFIIIENEAIIIHFTEPKNSESHNIFQAVIIEFFYSFDSVDLIMDMGITLYYKVHKQLETANFYINQLLWVEINTDILTKFDDKNIL